MQQMMNPKGWMCQFNDEHYAVIGWANDANQKEPVPIILHLGQPMTLWFKATSLYYNEARWEDFTGQIIGGN